MSELEIIGANDLLPGRIDADSWRHIRDSLIAARLLKRLDRGHYLLSKDLHTVTLAGLADLIRAEPEYRLTGLSLPWQQTAATLLNDNKDHESQCLNVSLADLFVTPKV